MNGPNQHAVGPSLLQGRSKCQVQGPGQVPREGGKGRKGQEGPARRENSAAAGRGYVPLRSREVLLRAGVLWRRCAALPPIKYPACRATSVPPSWGRAKGQCEVVRGKRQQLDELEFLSGRGAGGGRSWQGQPTIGDGWTEGSYGLLLACCLQAACACRLSSVVVKNHHHF